MAIETLSKHTRIVRRNLILVSFITLISIFFDLSNKEIKIPFYEEATLTSSEVQVIVFLILSYLLATFVMYFIVDKKDGGSSFTETKFFQAKIFAIDYLKKYLNENIIREWMNKISSKMFFEELKNDNKRDQFVRVFVDSYIENPPSNIQLKDKEEKILYMTTLFKNTSEKLEFNPLVLSAYFSPSGKSQLDVLKNCLLMVAQTFEVIYANLEDVKPHSFIKNKENIFIVEAAVPILLGGVSILFVLWDLYTSSVQSIANSNFFHVCDNCTCMC